MPEPRTAVMILVEATWEDQSGTLQTARARMENKSASGACIRVKARIRVGTRVKIRWRWEEFTGISKYCRIDGGEYRVGLQREAKKEWNGEEEAAADVPKRGNVPGRSDVAVGVEGTVLPKVARRESVKSAEAVAVAGAGAKLAAASAAKMAALTATLSTTNGAASKAGNATAGATPKASQVTQGTEAKVSAAGAAKLPESLPVEMDADESVIDEAPGSSQAREFCAELQSELQTELQRELELAMEQVPVGREAVKERNFMQSKWLSWRNKEEAPSANGNGANTGTGAGGESAKGSETGAAKSGKQAAESGARTERKMAMGGTENSAGLKVDLQAMEDIYRAAGIMTPRRGYSINKVVEMLYSDHIRGLSKEMRRASVLMALDAAGVSIEEVLRDAKARQEAIDSYESEQRKQFEAHWAQKAEENAGIQAEMERVKASYMERIKRNQDGVAREKATFLSWVTTKQQEAQNMAEAAALCSKPVEMRPVAAVAAVETEIESEENAIPMASSTRANLKVV